ncbi:MAG: phosphoribosylformylglycinamidine synthase I [Methanosaeta sp. PtaU1.Bin112]|nr:MAG: phosphoribosylformylglycinamidine synthase I [Methanosaeta sp. PtaU1.Bin112]
MKIAVMQFPGTNCEFETLVAVKAVDMEGEIFRWNRSAGELSDFDGFVIPGGFSYQDRIRAGVIASKEPVMSALKEEADKGKPILGICNGFQILVESGLLPGRSISCDKESEKGSNMGVGSGSNKASSNVDMALAQNVMISKGKIVRRGYYCDWVNLRHESPSKRCSGSFAIERGALLKIPIAHGEGNLVTTTPGLIKKLNDDQQVIFRYCDKNGRIINEFPFNVNGSTESIAAICNEQGNVLGMMPHPERAFFAWQLPAFDPRKQRADEAGPGRRVFESMKRYIEVNA